jgi:hypothetical protein
MPVAIRGTITNAATIEHGEWHRVPHLVAHLDGWIDDITEHVAWHYSSYLSQNGGKDRRLSLRLPKGASTFGSLGAASSSESNRPS